MNKTCRNVILIKAKYGWNLYLFLQNFLLLRIPLGSHILKHTTLNMIWYDGRGKVQTLRKRKRKNHLHWIWNYPLKLASFGFNNDQNQKASRGSAPGPPSDSTGPHLLVRGIGGSRVDKQKNELGRWKSRIVSIFLLLVFRLYWGLKNKLLQFSWKNSEKEYFALFKMSNYRDMM